MLLGRRFVEITARWLMAGRRVRSSYKSLTSTTLPAHEPAQPPKTADFLRIFCGALPTAGISITQEERHVQQHLPRVVVAPYLLILVVPLGTGHAPSIKDDVEHRNWQVILAVSQRNCCTGSGLYARCTRSDVSSSAFTRTVPLAKPTTPYRCRLFEAGCNADCAPTSASRRMSEALARGVEFVFWFTNSMSLSSDGLS